MVVSMKQAILKYLPTAEQVADILTKPLEANIFSFLRDKLGLKREGVLAQDAAIISISEIN
jgi:hypothetical protein